MITVVAFWWTDPAVATKTRYQYTAHDVEVRRNALCRHLTVPYEFVCVTDRPQELPDGVRGVAMDPTVFAPGTRYAKLMLFRRGIAGVLGDRILYFDLDAAVVRNIDAIASRPEPLIMFRNANYRVLPRRTLFDTGIMMLDAGARPDIYEKFGPAEDRKRRDRGFSTTDQWWISECVDEDCAVFTNDEGIMNASLIGGPHLPDKARIVLFPGNRHMSWPETQRQYPWLKTHYR
jgi:hypothetical protein